MYERDDSEEIQGQYVAVAGLGAAEPAAPWSGEFYPAVVTPVPPPPDPWATQGEGTFSPAKLADSFKALLGMLPSTPQEPVTVPVPGKPGVFATVSPPPPSKLPALVFLGGIAIVAVVLSKRKKKEA